MQKSDKRSSKQRAASLDRSVPNSSGGKDEKRDHQEGAMMRELVLSVSSINLSNNGGGGESNNREDPKSIQLLTRDLHGNVYTNLNFADADSDAEAASRELVITPDHVKYVNLFSILCCWCFPLTGLLSIFFARKTKRYYDANEMIRAKWYLNRAEWMLLLTFFFGLTLIATGFALFEVFWFNSHHTKPAGIYHATK